MGLCHRRNATLKALESGRYRRQHSIKTRIRALNSLILALRRIITAVASGVTWVYKYMELQAYLQQWQEQLQISERILLNNFSDLNFNPHNDLTLQSILHNLR